jgi:hypothetical protein
MPANLKLVFEHLNAVRELDRYLRRKGVDRDLERYVKETFCPKLQESVPALKEWNCDPAEWYPDSWKIKEDLYICLCVILPGPLDPDDDNPLRANIDETVLLVVITEQGENRNQCEEQRNLSSFSHGLARRGT